MRLPIQERLQQGVLLTDGSVAAELWRRGLREYPPEVYNLKQPTVVEEIHRAFVHAGAELLQTNTVRANRYALERYGLSDKVYELNRKGVWLARCAALRRAYVAGVVGPTGRFLAPVGSLEPEEARNAFVEQIVALVDGGAELLILKGFLEVQELCLAIEAAQVVSPGIPIIALKAFAEDGAVLAGTFPQRVVQELQRYPILALGAAGTVGPQRMVSLARTLVAVARKPVCALPDVSVPKLTEEGWQYEPDPQYLARAAVQMYAAGVRILGADGGATVECIRAIAEGLRNAPPPEPAALPSPRPLQLKESPPPEPTEFARKLGRKLCITVEIDLPRGDAVAEALAAAQWLLRYGVDAVNIADGARARLRISPIALAHLVQEHTGMECIAHLSCRDRNMVALQAELLGAHALGVRNILAVTGDPTHIGDYPYATSVFDVDSIGLVRILQQMNSGKDLMGNPLGVRTNFTIACACDPAAEQWERELERLQRKVAEGARVVFTQPLFDVELWERFRSAVAGLPVYVFVGVLPLRSLRHAEFLHYEVPGIRIPAWVRQRMARAETPEAALNEGIALAVEFLQAILPSVDGIYLMPPFRRYDVVGRILHELGLLLEPVSPPAGAP